jgi:alpha,alpha-trehalase
MRELHLALLVLLVFGFAHAQTLTARQLFSGLFEAVQLSDIFPDNKIFVDASPRQGPELIMKDYAEKKNNLSFNLKHFVNNNFIIPPDCSYACYQLINVI